MKFIKSSLIPMLALAALAASPVHAAGDEAAAKEADDNKRVCKKYRPTGTRIAKKTCMTNRQWKELQRRAQEAAKTSQRLGGHQNRESN